jgi:hypothetical protein
LDLSVKEGTSKSKFYRQLYTGLTRAKKATVGLIQNSKVLDSNNDRKPAESAGEFSLG